jgi:hypothetical protein
MIFGTVYFVNITQLLPDVYSVMSLSWNWCSSSNNFFSSYVLMSKRIPKRCYSALQN